MKVGSSKYLNDTDGKVHSSQMGKFLSTQNNLLCLMASAYFFFFFFNKILKNPQSSNIGTCAHLKHFQWQPATLS